MNGEELEHRYWKYYLMLEGHFIESIQYVELQQDRNYKAFSNGYALLLLAIGAELDTFFKEFCGFNKLDEDKAKDITTKDYAKYILSNKIYNKDIKRKLILRGYNTEIQPFREWDMDKPSQSLSWWTVYNDVKHNRCANLEQANQKNVLYALGALYLLEMMYLKDLANKDMAEYDIFSEPSKLFMLEKWSTITQADRFFHMTRGLQKRNRSVSGKPLEPKYNA